MNFFKQTKKKKLSAEEKRIKDRELWTTWVKKYAERVSTDMSDQDINKEDYIISRSNLMNSNNPRFILRNHIVQNAIVKAENNDFSEAKALLKLMENPYSNELLENILSEFYKGQCK
jgi:uncharacterized protein YdiU (UPF0061 family)